MERNNSNPDRHQQLLAERERLASAFAELMHHDDPASVQAEIQNAWEKLCLHEFKLAPFATNEAVFNSAKHAVDEAEDRRVKHSGKFN